MITPKIICSRTSGIAPLAVFFDATQTKDTATDYPFKDCHFQWDFGDQAAGVWSYGALPNIRSRNKHQGFVAAHVYDQPGTYTVKLRILSADRATTTTITQTITVQEFADVYPDSTYYIANGAAPVPGENGVPVGVSAAKCLGGITTLDAAISYLGDQKRLLFKRGDTFTTVIGVNFSYDNIYLDSFGSSGAKPVILKNSSGVESYSVIFGFAQGSAATNVNFSNLTVIGDYLGSLVSGLDAFYNSYDVSNILLNNLDITKCARGYGMNDSCPVLASKIFIDRCTMQDPQDHDGGNLVWGNSNQYAIQGSLLDRNGMREHCERHMHLNRAVIANNTYRAPAATKGLLSIRAGNFTDGFNNLPPGTHTQYVQVTGNWFKSVSDGTTQPTGTTSGNVTNDCRWKYVIFEKNLYTDIVVTATELLFAGDRVVARNNIMEYNNAVALTEGCNFIRVAEDEGVGRYYRLNSLDRTPVIPLKCEIMHNTAFTDKALTGNAITVAGAGGAMEDTKGAADSVIVNNLLVAPNVTTNNAVETVGLNAYQTGTVGATGTHGNSSDTQARTNPCESSTATGNYYGMKPLITGYAYQSGVRIAGSVVQDDFFDHMRVTATPNTGAIENIRQNYKYGSTIENSV